MTDERLTPERAVRLLRAKASEAEARVLAEQDYSDHYGEPLRSVTALSADLALIMHLLADEIERRTT